MRVYAYLLLVVCLICSCNHLDESAQIAPGLTRGGTHYYTNAAGECGKNPAFHLSWPVLPGGGQYRGVGDIHPKAGMEVLAYTKGKDIAVYDCNQNEL